MRGSPVREPPELPLSARGTRRRSLSVPRAAHHGGTQRSWRPRDVPPRARRSGSCYGDPSPAPAWVQGVPWTLTTGSWLQARCATVTVYRPCGRRHLLPRNASVCPPELPATRRRRSTRSIPPGPQPRPPPHLGIWTWGLSSACAPWRDRAHPRPGAAVQSPQVQGWDPWSQGRCGLGFLGAPGGVQREAWGP